MACTIKIKEREEYRTFDKEEEARKWIAENALTIEEIDGKEFITTTDPHSRTLSILEAANQKSWDDTQELLIQTRMNDWDTEEYAKNSKVASLSKVLADIRIERNGEWRRLFPEFITDNYLNVLVQKSILQEYLTQKGDSLQNIDALRVKYFDNDSYLPSKWRSSGERHSAKE